MPKEAGEACQIVFIYYTFLDRQASLFIYALWRNVLVLMIDAEERRRKKRGRLITNTTIECE